ncbi:unnamed protein product [Closterium sp. Naga37s-1]|nr:unnamed protein product [Closterium sp. Naga37s-1]
MEVRVVQSAATTAKPAESIATSSSDARPTCTQLAAITPPEAAALVPKEDFSDIEETRFWEDEGEDVEGRIVVRIVGKYLPAHVFPTDHVERYIHYKLHEIFSLAGPDRHVSILYIHTECESLNDNPLLAFRDIFQGLPPNLQQRVGAVYILHPSLTLRLGLWLLSPWLSDSSYGSTYSTGGAGVPASVLPPGMPSQAAPTSPSLLPTTPSLYSRMVCVSRVEFLWEHIQEDQVDLPQFCLPKFLLPRSPTTTTPLPSSLYSRVAFVSRVEFLWEHIREDQVDLPDFCMAHDGKLEAHPLLDYGFQLDRVAAGQHLPVGL